MTTTTTTSPRRRRDTAPTVLRQIRALLPGLAASLDAGELAPAAEAIAEITRLVAPRRGRR